MGLSCLLSTRSGQIEDRESPEVYDEAFRFQTGQELCALTGRRVEAARSQFNTVGVARA